MSAFEDLSIGLEHDIDEQYQYEPGEIVRGNIYIITNKPSSVRSIKINIFGQGNVGWEDEKDYSAHTSDEIYINASKDILNTNSEPLNIGRGRHEFRFEYQLTENLPSSYIGKYGSVTYLLKATVQGTRLSDTAITSEPFLVLRRSALPDDCENPLTMKNEKRLLSCFSLGKISIKVTINKQGAVPGEDLFIHAEIGNKTKRTITAIQGAIVMDSKYHAKNISTSFRQIVNKKRDEVDIGYNEARRWSYVRLTVPPYIPESKLDYCDIMDLSYFFQFRVELTGGTELNLQTPIIIGGLPAGLEIPDSNDKGNKINSQWTVRTKGMLYEGDGKVHLQNNDDYSEDVWTAGVPEMRPNSSIVNNPLFRQGSFMNPNNMKHISKVSVPEIMENTRL